MSELRCVVDVDAVRSAATPALDLVGRHFIARGPDQLRVADLTHIHPNVGGIVRS